jgi:hypothetical protein
MTAPLPPIANIPREYHAEVMDYAKLAVREALERAIERIRQPEAEGYPPMGSAKAAVAIRAMLKEHE